MKLLHKETSSVFIWVTFVVMALTCYGEIFPSPENLK